MYEEKILFISHITEDSNYAIALKNIIRSSYNDEITIFVSSDKESIPPGVKWFDYIIEELKKSKCVIILCSLQSIYRNWINFEAGYASARISKDLLIPLCIRGLKPSNLKPPLNFIQTREIRNINDLEFVLDTIDKKLDIKHSKADESLINIFNETFAEKSYDLTTNDWYNAVKIISPAIDKLQELIFRGFISMTQAENDILKFKQERFANFSFNVEDSRYLIEPCCLMSNLHDTNIDVINKSFSSCSQNCNLHFLCV